MVAKIFYRFLVLIWLLTPCYGADESPAEPANSQPTIYLRVGQRYPIEGLLSDDVQVSPETVVSAHKTPQGTLLVAHTPGTALMKAHSGEKEIQIQVVVRGDALSRNPDAWGQGLVALKHLPGIRLSQLGDKTVVGGEILGRNAYQQILLLAEYFPKKVVVLATPAAGIKASLIEQAQSLLTRHGLTGVNIANAGNHFFLEGTARTSDDVELALEAAQSIIPNVENHLPVPIQLEPTISVRVFMLELTRQAHEELGLSWPGVVNQALVLSPSQLAFSPVWAVSLKHLSNRGLARVLAEPILAVKNGSTAELSAGGEIPIKLTGRFENKVVWKRYGLKMKLRIAGIAGKHIRTVISSESSQLDDSTAVDGVPGLRSTEMSTEVDALEGQPVLLTGLFQSNAAKDIDKIPVLGSIPILGELFKSRRFREHESELLVALVPSFGAVPATLPLKTAHGLDFDVQWRLLD